MTGGVARVAEREAGARRSAAGSAPKEDGRREAGSSRRTQKNGKHPPLEAAAEHAPTTTPTGTGHPRMPFPTATSRHVTVTVTVTRSGQSVPNPNTSSIASASRFTSPTVL